jgi:hypothetical protein
MGGGGAGGRTGEEMWKNRGVVEGKRIRIRWGWEDWEKRENRGGNVEKQRNCSREERGITV